MTILENTYCVPMTLEEWRKLGVPSHSFGFNPDCVVFDNGKCVGRLEAIVKDYYTEIPVPRFLDLLQDRIVPWRVEEIGGYRYGNDSFYTINLPEHRCVLVHFEERVLVDARQLDKGLNIPNITTFTDLLTLIRFLTPNKNTNKP